MSESVWLRPEALEILHEEALAVHGGLAGVRDPGLLESALARPENAFAYGETDLFTLATLYTAGIVRNHPYLDGNKRAGFMAGAVFLQINGLMLTAAPADAVLKVIALAAGEIDETAFGDWLKANTKAL